MSNHGEYGRTPSAISMKSGASSFNSMLTPRSYMSGVTGGSKNAMQSKRGGKFSEAGKQLLSKLMNKK